jgi:hypothetical protein
MRSAHWIPFETEIKNQFKAKRQGKLCLPKECSDIYKPSRQYGEIRAAVGSGATSATYEYNEDSIRISKTAGGAKHTYYLNGTQIVAEEWSNKLLIYLYDESGSPIGMQYRTTSYAEGVFDTY